MKVDLFQISRNELNSVKSGEAFDRCIDMELFIL